MADVTKLKPFILKWEGGFVSDPADLGGATNKGVTIGTYKEYRKKKGLPESTVEELKKLLDNEWTDILKTYYWDCWKVGRKLNCSGASMISNLKGDAWRIELSHSGKMKAKISLYRIARHRLSWMRSQSVVAGTSRRYWTGTITSIGSMA